MFAARTQRRTLTHNYRSPHIYSTDTASPMQGKKRAGVCSVHINRRTCCRFNASEYYKISELLIKKRWRYAYACPEWFETCVQTRFGETHTHTQVCARTHTAIPVWTRIPSFPSKPFNPSSTHSLSGTLCCTAQPNSLFTFFFSDKQKALLSRWSSLLLSRGTSQPPPWPARPRHLRPHPCILSGRHHFLPVM